MGAVSDWLTGGPAMFRLSLLTFVPSSALNAQHSHVETSRLDLTEYSQKVPQ
jgi:hypothetical protein